MGSETGNPVERQELVDGLRRAVQCLYGCRYSEVPLAQELDVLLKRETGKTYGEWLLANYTLTYPMNVDGGYDGK